MLLLYITFILMLISAMGVLAIPFIKNQMSIFSRSYFIMIIFTLLFTLTIYHFYARTPGLTEWLTHGKRHYELMAQFEHLGGIDGMINKIKITLAKHPNDAEGLALLHKLYVMKGDPMAANTDLK